MVLSESKLFQGLSEEDINSLLGCLGAVRREYGRGETILSEGKVTESLGIVLSGRAIISRSDIWGNNSVLGSADPGEVFAEVYACIPGEPLRISVTAAEDTTVLFLNVGRVLSTCSNACPFHTKLVGNLLTVCAHKSLSLSQRILHTSSKSIRGRLMSFFSECVRSSGSCEFRIPYNRQQLADYLGVDRSALSGELSKMRKEGLLEYEKNWFHLKLEE